MVALSVGFTIFPEIGLPSAGIFTILRRGSHYFIALRACARTRARLVTRLFSATCRQDSKESSASLGGTAHYIGAPTCIVLAKIGLWLSISITRTDWLRSRAAYSPGVHTYTGGTESLADKGIRRILPGKSSCSMITYYTASAPSTAKSRQKNVSKSLL